MEAARGFQLARYGRLQLAFTALTLFSASLCLWAFGLPWTALLLCCGATSYNLLSHFCYQPEGREWRAKLERSYWLLFRYLFGTSASPAPPGMQVKPGRRSRAGTPTFSGSSREPQVSALCHKEAQKIIDLITRDLISDWYKDVTGDVELPDEVKRILEHVALEVNLRLQNVDLNETVCELLALVLLYLEAVNEAGNRDHNGIQIFDVEHEKCFRAFESNPKVAHRALKSPEAEAAYYRQGLDTLIQVALPAEYKNCDVARTFVREILLENVLVPLLDLLCDPDFIYEAIPLILDKAQPEKIQRELAEIELENEQLEREHQRQKLFLLSRRNTQRKRFWSLSGRFTQSAVAMTPLSAPGSRDSPEAHRRASVATISVSKHPGSKMEARRLSSLPVHTSKAGQLPEAKTEALSREHQSLPVELKPKTSNSVARTPPLIRQKTSPSKLHGYTGLPPPLKTRAHSVDVIPSRDRKKSTTPELGIDVIAEEEEEKEEDFDDDMVLIDLPPICLKHHVTVNAGGSSHIGYIFEFPKRMLSDMDLQELGVMQNDTHLEAMKRYSDFVTFHGKLLRSELATYAKSCDLPDRRTFTNLVSKLPFSGRDPTVILERKEGLERYIQSISAVKAVRESMLFCNFLKSGVEVLRDAAIISPQQRAAGSRKKALLRIMKGHGSSDDATAKVSPRRPIDTVLSSYLNTHLPLPCRSLHSLQSIHFSSSPTLRDRTSPSTSSLSQSEADRSQTATESSLDTFATACSGSSAEFSGDSHDVDGGSPRPRSSSSPARGDSNFDLDEGSGERLGQRVKRHSSADSVCLQSQSSIEDSATAGVGSFDLHPPLYREDKSETKSTPCSGPELPPNGYETKIPPFNNTVTMKKPGSPRKESTLQRTLSYCKLFYTKLTSWFLQVLSFLKYIFNQGSLPITHANTHILYNERHKSTPLANALLSLATEGSKSSCPELWATSKGSQLVLLSILGGAIDQFLWKELHEVVYYEENWIRAVYHLRHTLWPGGKLDTSPRRKRSEEEKAREKEKAAESFKRFLPDFLPYLVGHTDYDRAVKHCLECLQNPKINRHFFLAVVDLLLTKIAPEIQGRDFKRHLARMRAIKLVSSQRRRGT